MPAPRPPTRPALRARYDARREEVLIAAAALFAQRGLERSTMADLVEATGLAAGGLYHYGASKEELAREICNALVEPLLDQARELVAAGGDPQQQLRELVRMWVRHVVEHRDQMLVFDQVRHVADVDPQWREVRATRKAFEGLVRNLLAEVELVPGLDPRVGLSALLGAVNATAQWYSPSGRLTPDEIADGYVALVMRALSQPLPATPGR